MTEPLELCVKGASDDVVAYACGVCRYVAPDRTAAVECCVPRLCSQCGAATGQKHLLVCYACRDARWAEERRLRAEQRRAEATRIALGDYDQQLVCKDIDGDEGSYITVDDALDEGLEWAWAVTPLAWPTIDAGDVVSNALEDEFPDDADDRLDTTSLQAAIDAWWVAQGECPFAIVDEKRIVELVQPSEDRAP